MATSQRRAFGGTFLKNYSSDKTTNVKSMAPFEHMSEDKKCDKRPSLTMDDFDMFKLALKRRSITEPAKTCVKEVSPKPLNTNSNRHNCDNCEATFSHADHLDFHIKTIHKLSPDFNCKICNFVSFSEKTLNVHLRKIHSESLDSSDSSGTEIKERKEILTQIEYFLNKSMIVMNSGGFKCETCQKKTNSDKQIIYHMSMKHNMRPRFICSTCSKAFNSSIKLKSHEQKFHSKKSILSCHKCSARFFNMSTLTHHVKSFHLKIKHHQCHLCNKTFSQKCNFEEHMSSAHFKSNSTANKSIKGNDKNSEKFQPPKFSVSVKSDLTVDIKPEKEDDEASNEEKSNNVDQFVYCTICKKEFSSYYVLLRHKNNDHPSTNDYLCYQCDLTFTHKKLVRNHLNEHHKNMLQFVCHHCQKDFKSKPLLVQHIENSHLFTDRLYCKTCSNFFVSVENLSHHIKSVHKKLRPFKCSRCDSAFAVRQKLQRHFDSVHLKLKPFKCPFTTCEKCFSTSGNMKQHYESVHSKNMYITCMMCPAKFNNRRYISQHMKVVHKTIL